MWPGGRRGRASRSYRGPAQHRPGAGSGSSVQVGQVEDEAVPDVVAFQAFKGPVHLGRRQQFDVGGDVVPGTEAQHGGEDLADWAVGLYDEYLARPDLIRLATWALLERRPAAHLVTEHEQYDDHKLHAIAEAQAAGRIRQGDPFDVMTLVIAMPMAWSPVSNVYAATVTEPPEVHDQRRELLRDCVRRTVAPA